jgi:P27 family predicted phage terminase small subunit
LPEAKREWSRVVAELDQLGLLTIIDRATLAGYCQAYGRAVEAEKVLAESEEGMSYTTDSGQRKPLPEVAIAERAWQLVRAYAAEFGFTPASRTRIATPQREREPDGLEEFLRRGNQN